MHYSRARQTLALLLAITGSTLGQTLLKEDFETPNARKYLTQPSVTIQSGCGEDRGSCLSVSFPRADPTAGGSADKSLVLWRFPAQTWIGKTVRLRGWAQKRNGENGVARVWIRTEGRRPWPLENNGKTRHTVASGGWNHVQLEREVDENDAIISVGVESRGGAQSVWLDNLELDIIASAVTPLTTPAATDISKVQWIRQNAIPIRSIDPEDEDFSDLQKLKSKIGDARIVVLGEQSHGDGATFLIKQRLIRFLHQQMGFDILAWESGFFTAEVMNEAISNGVEPQQCLRLGLFSVWGESPLLVPIVQYAQRSRSSSNPLQMTGLDNGFLGVARDELVPRIKSFFRNASPGTDPDGVAAIAELLEALDVRSPVPYRPTPEQREFNRQRLQKLLRVLQAGSLPTEQQREATLLTKAVEDLLDYEQLRTVGLNRSGAMGESLAWIVNEWYPGHKVIVWCHNTHGSRDGYLDPPAAVDPDIARVQRLGLGTLVEAAERELGSVLYSIYFTAHHGKWSTVHSAPARFVAPISSLETLLHGTGRPYSFLDFKSVPGDHWLRKQQTGLALYKPSTKVWPTHFDALVFTDEMFSSRPDGYAPARTKRKD